jgi:hypothetical protein
MGLYADGILARFEFHPATIVTGPMHDSLRAEIRKTADYILSNIPSGRHQSLALTSLQETMMWCNAAIAMDLES